MNKKLKAIVLLLLLALSVPLCAEVKDTVLTFDRSLLQMETVMAGDEASRKYIRMSYGRSTDEVGYVETAGHPCLPLCHCIISIPHDAKDVSVTCKMVAGSSIALEHEIYPVQHPIPTGIGYESPAFCQPAPEAYVDKFPRSPVSITDISCFGEGDRLVGVNVCPLVYYPQESRCELARSVTLHVAYSIDKKARTANVRGKDMCPTSLPFYEYCVITSRKLSRAFTRLIGWERQKGLNAGVVCVEDILSDPVIKGDTVSHIYDDAGKVRQYLQYAYKYGGAKYVLFGGNDQVLPIRYGFSEAIRKSEYSTYLRQVPSDFYFSELDSRWEIGVMKNTPLTDYGSELEVGRLLCTTREEIENYTDKLLRYEINPGKGDYSYLNKLLFTEANEMQEKREAEESLSAIEYMFPNRKILSCGTSSAPTSVTGTDIVRAMREHYGYVSWFNHGTPTAIIVNNSDVQEKHGLVSVCGEDIDAVQESGNGLDSLENKHYPMIAYSLACTIAPFDITDSKYDSCWNLGQSFTLGKDYGGPVLIGNSRVGFIESTHKMQMEFHRYMMECTLAGALNWAKWSNTALKVHHALAVNLLGSPNVKMWTNLPKRFNARMEFDGVFGGDLYTDSDISDAAYSIRYLEQQDDSLFSGFYDPSGGTIWLSDIRNGIVTLYGRNCLPQIMPMKLQCLSLYGARHLLFSDADIGSDVMPSDDLGPVIMKGGSDTTIEYTGKVTLTRGVTVEKGASLKIIPSDIKY